MRWTLATGDGICKIRFQLERQLCQSFVHLTKYTSTNFQAISIPDRCTSQLVIFKWISAAHPKHLLRFLFGWSPVSWWVPQILTRDSIPRLELCILHVWILTWLLPPWNEIVLMNSRDDVILFWLPGLGIIQNDSRLHKSVMAHALWVQFLNVCWLGYQLFDHSITQKITIFTRTFLMKHILMFCSLWVSIQYATCSGNTLLVMSISFGSLMKCISCSWV